MFPEEIDRCYADDFIVEGIDPEDAYRKLLERKAADDGKADAVLEAAKKTAYLSKNWPQC